MFSFVTLHSLSFIPFAFPPTLDFPVFAFTSLICYNLVSFIFFLLFFMLAFFSFSLLIDKHLSSWNANWIRKAWTFLSHLLSLTDLLIILNLCFTKDPMYPSFYYFVVLRIRWFLNLFIISQKILFLLPSNSCPLSHFAGSIGSNSPLVSSVVQLLRESSAAEKTVV